MNHSFHGFGTCRKIELKIANDIAFARVGHAAHVISDGKNDSEWILIICGATSLECCKNYVLINIYNHETISLPLPPNKPPISRYEQASAIYNTELVLFGGADTESPLGDAIHLEIDTCSLFNEANTITNIFPKPPVNALPSNSCMNRTQHTSNCITGNGELIVFGGGRLGSDPVDDEQVYLYNIKHKSWKTIKTVGTAPTKRMGHLMLFRSDSLVRGSHVSSLFVHGGMAGNEFYDDFFRLEIHSDTTELSTGLWTTINDRSGSEESVSPPPRAAHGGAITLSPKSSSKSRIFVFGGVNSKGSLNDLYYYDEDSLQWIFVKLSGPLLPSPRMDFAYVLLKIRTKLPPKNSPRKLGSFLSNFNSGSETVSDDDEIDERTEKCDFLFLQGGMDIEGNMFNDAYVICLHDSTAMTSES